MRLPALLSRRNPNVHKNQFGHVLVIAGSSRMLGAAALCGLAAMRTGAGLVTIGVAKSLNLTLQAKIDNVIMTMPLPETRGSIAAGAYTQIKKVFSKFQAVAIGPGMGQEVGTRKFIFKMIQECPLPMVVDADALNAVSSNPQLLIRARGPRVLTPHSGEMTRLTGLSMEKVQGNRSAVACDFARKYHCVLVLKGHRTIVASPEGKIYINKTGNSGMATAGSGDVLAGMITALLGQGVDPFQSAKTACYVHGHIGDIAAQGIGKASLIASDLVDLIPQTIKERA